MLVQWLLLALSSGKPLGKEAKANTFTAASCSITDVRRPLTLRLKAKP